MTRSARSARSRSRRPAHRATGSDCAKRAVATVPSRGDSHGCRDGRPTAPPGLLSIPTGRASCISNSTSGASTASVAARQRPHAFRQARGSGKEIGGVICCLTSPAMQTRRCQRCNERPRPGAGMTVERERRSLVVRKLALSAFGAGAAHAGSRSKGDSPPSASALPPRRAGPHFAEDRKVGLGSGRGIPLTRRRWANAILAHDSWAGARHPLDHALDARSLHK
jgi:hypothetical protein